MAGGAPRAIAAAASGTKAVCIALLAAFAAIPRGFESTPIRWANPLIDIIASPLLTSSRKPLETKTPARVDSHD
jgi:hypothetical protein